MGIFSRNEQDESTSDNLFDKLSLPTRDDFKQPLIDEPGNKSRRGAYGIDDAIALMRGLPGDQDNLVVEVVRKTLASANIELSDIIADASRKEASIRQRHGKLGDEIESLQAQIDQRKVQMQALEQDLAETGNVRERLQSGAPQASPKGPSIEPASTSAHEQDSETAFAPDADLSSSAPRGGATAGRRARGANIAH